MSANIYTNAEFATFAADAVEAKRKAESVPYTNVSVTTRPSVDENEIVVDEIVDQAVMLAALQAATPPANLSVDNADQTIQDNGSDTATYNLTGAPGATVNLAWLGSIVINKSSLVLDGGGLGSFVAGPYQPGNITDAQGIAIFCSYQGNIADGVKCTLVVQ